MNSSAPTTGMSITIRPATSDDVPQMCFAQECASESLPEEFFRRRLAEGHALVAADCLGRVLGQGFYQVTTAGDGRKFVYLYLLHVDPPLRGQGIGTRLMEAREALGVEEGCCGALLGVDERNPRARALYERRGYALYEERDIEVETGIGATLQIHEFLMVKWLGGQEVAT